MYYVCINEDCPEKGNKVYYSSERYKYVNGELRGENCVCPFCGSIRKEVSKSEEIPLSEKNVGMNFFQGMSIPQRKEALKKRSHEHFEKHVKEYKTHLLNEAQNEMRDMRSGKL